MRLSLVYCSMKGFEYTRTDTSGVTAETGNKHSHAGLVHAGLKTLEITPLSNFNPLYLANCVS